MYNIVKSREYEYIEAKCTEYEIREMHYYALYIYMWLNPRRSICYSQ